MSYEEFAPACLEILRTNWSIEPLPSQDSKADETAENIWILGRCQMISAVANPELESMSSSFNKAAEDNAAYETPQHR